MVTEIKLTKTQLKKQVTYSVVDLVRFSPFYGHIIQQLIRVYISGKTAKIPTMAVGKQSSDLLLRLFVNLDFIEELIRKYCKPNDPEQGYRFIVGCLEHEVLHLIFNHLTLKFTDRTRGNVACDLSVNSYINENKLPPGALYPTQFELQPKKAAFWYYVHLQDNPKYKKMLKDGAFGTEGQFCDALESHGTWKEAASDPIVGDFIKDIVRKSKDLCSKSYGNTPQDLVNQLDGLLKTKKPIVPWGRVLRCFCANAMESRLDYTMKRISKRYGTRPGTRKEDVLNLAVGVDTSGSISDYQLKVFFNEIRHIWKNGAQITVYECDADVQAVYKFKGKFNGEVHGRGGTAFEPVLEAVERKYDALIYFTDFYGPSPSRRYNIPILWVLTTELEREAFPYEWGRFIKIDAETGDVEVV